MGSKTVLVIDDSIMIRKMVASILADQFEVLEAKDGSLGLDMARRHHPDLILLDFVMPKMDGYDTMQAIRREDELKGTPIIMMSGLKEQVTARIPEPFVGFEFIEKPFEADMLLNKIQQSLKMGPAVVAEVPGEPTLQLLISKMTSLETLLIQGIENLIQREVVSRMNGFHERLQHQESQSTSLEHKVDKLLAEIERQNRGLGAIANELRQIRKLLG